MKLILAEMLRERVGSSFDNEATFSADEIEQIIAALESDTPPPLPQLMGVEDAAKILAEWIGYAWDGMSDRDIQETYPDWVGQKIMQGGKPALRKIAQRILSAQPAPAEHVVGAEERGIGIGMAIAAGIIMRVWGRDEYAKEILGAAGLDTLDKLKASGIDQYDIDALMPVVAENATDALSEEDRNYLEEVADGAWGDDPRTRGLARDRLKAATATEGSGDAD